MISEEFISEMTEHNTSAKGMNWDWGTGDICTGDRSPETHTHTHQQIIEWNRWACCSTHKHTWVREVSL